MDYREHLRQPLSKHFVDLLIEEIFAKPDDFGMVYQLVFDSNEKIAWRAAWACQKISDKYPEWFSDKQYLELASLSIKTTHGGLQRGCLATIYNLTIPDPIPVDFLNVCFERMVSPRFPIAVQAISMKILYEICMIEIDLIPEYRTYLETISPSDYSKGFNATRNNILKKLNAK